jgi:hypothetical protein
MIIAIKLYVKSVTQKLLYRPRFIKIICPNILGGSIPCEIKKRRKFSIFISNTINEINPIPTQNQKTKTARFLTR